MNQQCAHEACWPSTRRLLMARPSSSWWAEPFDVIDVRGPELKFRERVVVFSTPTCSRAHWLIPFEGLEIMNQACPHADACATGQAASRTAPDQDFGRARTVRASLFVCIRTRTITAANWKWLLWAAPAHGRPLGHTTQPGDFKRATIGERSVIVTRADTTASSACCSTVARTVGWEICQARVRHAKGDHVSLSTNLPTTSSNLMGVPFKRGIRAGADSLPTSTPSSTACAY